MPRRCTMRGCRSRSSIWATSTSASDASRWRPRCSSIGTSSPRWSGWPRRERESKCARCRPRRRWRWVTSRRASPTRSRRSHASAPARRRAAPARPRGDRGGAFRLGGGRAQGGVPADAVAAAGPGAGAGLAFGRRTRRAAARRAARAALSRWRQSRRQPARQRVAAGGRADGDGDPGGDGGRHRRRRPAGGDGAGAPLPAGDVRTAARARLGISQRPADGRGNHPRRARRSGGSAGQPAGAAVAFRRGGRDRRSGGAGLAAPRLPARGERAGSALGPRRRLAHGLGGGGGMRHPGHPRSPRAGHSRAVGGGRDCCRTDRRESVVMPAAAVAQGARHVSWAGLVRVFLRSLFLQASWNPRGMQNVGFADAIGPALTELYPEPAERAKAVARHLEFFNCHPYMAAAILGGAVRLEERVASGELPAQTVSSFKSTLGPPFAALGDGFFWLALRPTSALAAAVTEPFLGLGCVLVFLGLYNSVHVAVRCWPARWRRDRCWRPDCRGGRFTPCWSHRPSSERPRCCRASA